MTDNNARIEKALTGVEEALTGLPENEVIAILGITFGAQYKDMTKYEFAHRLEILNEQALQAYAKRQ